MEVVTDSGLTVLNDRYVPRPCLPKVYSPFFVVFVSRSSKNPFVVLRLHRPPLAVPVPLRSRLPSRTGMTHLSGLSCRPRLHPYLLTSLLVPDPGPERSSDQERDSRKNQVNCLPLLGGEERDRLRTGCHVNSRTVPSRKVGLCPVSVGWRRL